MMYLMLPASDQPPRVAAVSAPRRAVTARKTRTFTHMHRQRLERAVAIYLRDCYRAQAAARTSELAARMGVVPQYLSGIARKILGKPLQLFLREKQLEEAARLLIQTPLEVGDIARRSGFGTHVSLYRWFLKTHGVAPSAYRELKK